MSKKLFKETDTKRLMDTIDRIIYMPKKKEHIYANEFNLLHYIGMKDHNIITVVSFFIKDDMDSINKIIDLLMEIMGERYHLSIKIFTNNKDLINNIFKNTEIGINYIDEPLSYIKLFVNDYKFDIDMEKIYKHIKSFYKEQFKINRMNKLELVEPIKVDINKYFPKYIDELTQFYNVNRIIYYETNNNYIIKFHGECIKGLSYMRIDFIKSKLLKTLIGAKLIKNNIYKFKIRKNMYDTIDLDDIFIILNKKFNLQETGKVIKVIK